ncbi:MAG: MarR family winged helix-turn-helix transcriptional regulator [Gammaproteobacteria bacterium]
MSLVTRKVRVLVRDQFVPYLLGRVSKQIASAASVLYRQWFRVGINNARVVISLSRYPGSTAMTLCADTGLHKAVVSRSLRVLHAKKFIRFDDSAARRRKISLTAKGDTLSQNLQAVMLERERLLLRGLSAAEKRRLVKYLQRIMLNIPTANAYQPRVSLRARARAR